MKDRLRIPGYSNLSPKNKQRANLVLGGLFMMVVVMIVSGMIGTKEVKSLAPEELPKPKPIAATPGAQLDARDAWMGGAGKDLAKLRDEVKGHADEITRLRGELKLTLDTMRGDMKALVERGVTINTPTGQPAPIAPITFPPAPVPTPPQGGTGSTNAGGVAGPAVPAGPAAAGARPVAVNQPGVFPSQRGVGAGRTSNGAGAAGSAYPAAPVPTSGGLNPGPNPALNPVANPAMGYSPGGLVKVSATGTGGTDGAASSASASGGLAVNSGTGAVPASGAPAKPLRTVANFLPVGFTRAVLLGGLAAPTGGQAQGNPVPVLLRLADLSVLPNGWRGQVKECLVVGEGYGDHSAERAYIRTTLLSCVMRDGQIVESPIKGSVFGEDGMNGVMGKLVTKQGAILGNALLSGIASGIGNGITQATQTVSTTALGQVNASPTDASSILKQGFGTGVGRAMDRLAQYYINLAERTFPVIEVQPGRYVDVVMTQGVAVDVPLVAGAQATSARAGYASRNASGSADRRPLLRTALDEGDEE